MQSSLLKAKHPSKKSLFTPYIYFLPSSSFLFLTFFKYKSALQGNDNSYHVLAKKQFAKTFSGVCFFGRDWLWVSLAQKRQPAKYFD